MPHLRPSRASDVDEIFPVLLQEDLEDMTIHGLDPFETLQVGVEVSDFCVTAEHAGRPLAILGVNEFQPGVGVIWMAVSPELLHQHQRWFLRMCRPTIEKLNKLYPLLMNYVPATAKTRRRWLSWLGFTETKHHFETEGHVFIPYFRKRDTFHE